MANSNDSRWYYLSATIYYIIGIIGAIIVALAGILKCWKELTPTKVQDPIEQTPKVQDPTEQTPKVQDPTKQISTVQNPTVPPPTEAQDACKLVENALNQRMKNQVIATASTIKFLSPSARAKKQLSDGSTVDEGALSDYLQNLRIQPTPKPLHIQDCQWDKAHQYIEVLILKE